MKSTDRALEQALTAALHLRAREVAESAPPDAGLMSPYVELAPPARGTRRRPLAVAVASIAAAAAVAAVVTIQRPSGTTITPAQSPADAPTTEPALVTTTTLVQLVPPARVILSGNVDGKAWRLASLPTAEGRVVRLDGVDMEGQFLYPLTSQTARSADDPGAPLVSVISPCCRLNDRTLVVAVVHPSVNRLIVMPSGADPITAEPVAVDDRSSWHYAVLVVPPTTGTISVVTGDGQSHDVPADGNGWDFARVGN